MKFRRGARRLLQHMRQAQEAIRRCEEIFQQAEERVEKITLDTAGNPTGAQPLEVS
jgi:exonuclease VII small subunit